MKGLRERGLLSFAKGAVMFNKLLLLLIVITLGYAVSAIYIPMSETAGQSVAEAGQRLQDALSADHEVSIARTVIKKGALVEDVSLLNAQALVNNNLSTVAGEVQIVAPTLEMLDDETAIMEADMLMNYQPADEAARQRLLEELRVASSMVSAIDRESQAFVVVDDGVLMVPATDGMQVEELLPSAKMTD